MVKLNKSILRESKTLFAVLAVSAVALLAASFVLPPLGIIDQSDDRTLVAIEQNGEPKKFFTSSIEMRNILEQIREVQDGFPFETTIRAETFGKGKTKYVFS